MLFNNYKFTLCYFIAVIIIPLNGFSEDKTDRNLFPFSSDQLIEIVKSPEHYYAITRKKGIFDSFDKEPFAAASLGQVHKAIYEKKEIVCKLQYPDMLSIVEADIEQLKLLFSIYKKIDKTIDTSEIQKEIPGK